jgi:hypothetical protein
MPQGDSTSVAVDPQVKWFGEEEIFTIGARKIKIWELLVGLLVLSMFMPVLINLTSRKSGGKK